MMPTSQVLHCAEAHLVGHVLSPGCLRCWACFQPPRSMPARRPAVAERRVGDALVLLRRLDKLLQRLAAAADRQDPAEQVGGPGGWKA